MTLKGTFCFTNNDKHAKISKKSLVRQSIGGPCSQKMWIEQKQEKSKQEKKEKTWHFKSEEA